MVENNEEQKRRTRPGPPNRRPASKRHKENWKKVDKKQRYSLEEALSILKSLPGPKFDEAVEIAMKLGIDPRKSDQMVRGSVSLPKGIGKEVKILAFAEGDIAEKAQEAGADIVGGQEIVEKIQKENWFDFDIAIAHPSMMRFVGKVGRLLGPKGKMPSPKSGTVAEDVATAVREFKAGKVEFRADSGGNIQASVGKKSFSVEDLAENIGAFVEHIRSIKPPTSKGTYVQKVVVSTTMGPGIMLEVKR